MSARYRYTCGRVHFTVHTGDVLRVFAIAPQGAPVDMPAQDYQGYPWTGAYERDGYANLGVWLCAGLLSVYPHLAEQAEYNDAEDRYVMREGGPLAARVSL